MIKRVVEISSAGTHLSVRHDQLILKRDGEVIGQIPCEDIGVLVVDHQGTSYTHCVFTSLLKQGAAVVLCNGTHHPAGMLLPLETNSIQTERFRQQINATEPVKKRLWQQIVRAKIRHQAKVVSYDETTYRHLQAMARRVRSGDPENLESQAARKFWPAYLQHLPFKRDREGTPPNNLLNYGYMVMRAAVGRALCSAGLLPALGIHHRNRYNSFCLADDLMEPFRGFVETRVQRICSETDDLSELTQDLKGRLLEVLYEDVRIAGFSGPLMVGLHRTGASLARCFAGEQKELELPEL